jgi:DNA-binding NtrC family response regulator
MMIERILLVSEDDSLRAQVEQCLKPRWQMAREASLQAAQQVLNRESFDLVIADGQLPDGAGTQLLDNLKAVPGRPILVVVFSPDAAASAAECVRSGAFGFLLKPVLPEQLEVLIQQAESFRRLSGAAQYLAEAGSAELIGRSRALEELRGQARRVARTEATILIQGEPGVGKKFLARVIHSFSPRAETPLLEVDCASISEGRIERLLFGDGAGPADNRVGVLELAHGGAVLLEEIGALPLAAQARLLRVLETRKLERPGSRSPSPLTARVMTTTSRDLPAMVERKTFHEGLFHALNGLWLHVPPLRERPEDIPLLVQRFCEIFARRHGRSIPSISPASWSALQDHEWPGNLRELYDNIERAMLRCPAGILEPEHLHVRIGELSAAAPGLVEREAETLDDAEMRHILAVLARCHGNRTHAAKRLGISLRTLRNKLREVRSPSAATTDAESAANSPRGNRPLVSESAKRH